YTNVPLILKASGIIGDFIASLRESNGENYEYSLFYPESGLNNVRDKIDLIQKFQKVWNSYEVLVRWDDFLAAISKNRWEDEEGCLPEDPLGENCGRSTAGNYA